VDRKCVVVLLYHRQHTHSATTEKRNLRQRHSNHQKINLLLQELMHFLLTCAAVPLARERTIWITGARDNVPSVFLGLGRFARGCSVCDNIHAHGFGHAGDCEGTLASPHFPLMHCSMEEQEGHWASGRVSTVVRNWKCCPIVGMAEKERLLVRDGKGLGGVARRIDAGTKNVGTSKLIVGLRRCWRLTWTLHRMYSR
jgi:hypothetical protein